MSRNRPSLISLPITVMTYDIDYAQIVHNAVYIRWLEDLRTALIGDVYPIEDMLADGISPILTKTEIEYRLPVRFGDDVIGLMWATDLGRTRWTVEAEIRVGGPAQNPCPPAGLLRRRHHPTPHSHPHPSALSVEALNLAGLSP